MVQVPAPRRFTVKEYYRMARAGILGPDDRVELIEGEIVEMPPISDRHAVCVDLLNRVLVRALPDDFTVRVQGPVRLSDMSEPVPDLAVLNGEPVAFLSGHPRPEQVSLIIEVALSSLNFDRKRKLPLYARTGIPEVWIVNLRSSRVEQYSDPIEGEYQSTRIVGPGESLALPGTGECTISVDAFLNVERSRI